MPARGTRGLVFALFSLAAAGACGEDGTSSSPTGSGNSTAGSAGASGGGGLAAGGSGGSVAGSSASAGSGGSGGRGGGGGSGGGSGGTAAAGAGGEADSAEAGSGGDLATAGAANAGAGGSQPCPQPEGSYLCMAPLTAASIDQLITACPPAAVLDAIDVDFDIRFEFVTTDPNGPELVCTTAGGSRDLTHTQERIYQALIALRALEFEQALPWTTLPLYEWMTESIEGIRVIEGVGSACCTPPSGASGNYVTIESQASRTWLTSDLWAMTWGGGLFDLVQLLVHETRHANDKLHTCGGSDDTIAELGAWGAVYWFSRAVAFDSDPCFVRPYYGEVPQYPEQCLAEEDYLVVARSYSRDVHNVRFCSEPSDPVEPPEAVTVCPD
jgi:hypothetical protein